MQIHIIHDGQQQGPYDIEETKRLLAAGSILPSDLAWYDGLSNWIQLSSVPGMEVPMPPAPKMPPVPPVPVVPGQSSRGEYSDYKQVPWYRRSGINSLFILLNVLSCGWIPGIPVVCISLITGNVFFKTRDENGRLKKWGKANKLLAFVLMLCYIAVIALAFLGGLRERLSTVWHRESPTALYERGNNFFNGNGVAQDQVAAVKCFQQAAEQNYSPGELSLGWCLANGLGTAKNLVEAAKWYRKSADQGNADAQYQLGWCFQNGLGLEKNPPEAVKWYQAAATQGNALAQCALGWCLESGDGIAQDQEAALKWYKLSAEQGIPMAQTQLGWFYANGTGVEKNESTAFSLFQKAAQAGYPGAQFALGLCYGNGTGVAKDDVVAVQWFQKAADQGLADAQTDLGLAYLNGYGVQQDQATAIQWLQKAAAQGYPKAQAQLKEAEDLENTTRLLNSIILPRLELHGATVVEVINFLTQKSKELDPAHQGVKIVLDPTDSQANARITLTLSNIPLYEALRYVCSLAKLNSSIGQDAVVLKPSVEQPNALVAKCFEQVPTAFFGNSAPSDGPACQACLSQHGIEFPEGASARYFASTQQLFVKNTNENNTRIEALLLAWNNATKSNR